MERVNAYVCNLKIECNNVGTLFTRNRNFLEKGSRLTLLPLVCATDTNRSSAEEKESRFAVKMPCIINTCVHF